MSNNSILDAPIDGKSSTKSPKRIQQGKPSKKSKKCNWVFRSKKKIEFVALFTKPIFELYYSALLNSFGGLCR